MKPTIDTHTFHMLAEMWSRWGQACIRKGDWNLANMCMDRAAEYWRRIEWTN